VLAYFTKGDEEEVVLDPAGLIKGSVSVRPVTEEDRVDIGRVRTEIDQREAANRAATLRKLKKNRKVH
jgi:hypothetical protein